MEALEQGKSIPRGNLRCCPKFHGILQPSPSRNNPLEKSQLLLVPPHKSFRFLPLPRAELTLQTLQDLAPKSLACVALQPPNPVIFPHCPDPTPAAGGPLHPKPNGKWCAQHLPSSALPSINTAHSRIPSSVWVENHAAGRCRYPIAEQCLL